MFPDCLEIRLFLLADVAGNYGRRRMFGLSGMISFWFFEYPVVLQKLVCPYMTLGHAGFHARQWFNRLRCRPEKLFRAWATNRVFSCRSCWFGIFFARSHGRSCAMWQWRCSEISAILLVVPISGRALHCSVLASDIFQLLWDINPSR